MELPPDRLVPMVPQRLNYIHWLEDLLSETREKEEEKEERVLGIDIGRDWSSRSLGVWFDTELFCYHRYGSFVYLPTSGCGLEQQLAFPGD